MYSDGQYSLELLIRYKLQEFKMQTQKRVIFKNHKNSTTHPTPTVTTP